VANEVDSSSTARDGYFEGKLKRRLGLFFSVLVLSAAILSGQPFGCVIDSAPVVGPAAEAGAQKRHAFSSAEYVAAPKLDRTSVPVYPFEAAAAHVQGAVRILALVDERGRVTKTEVIASDPAGVFEETTKSGMKKWRFQTEKRDGKPIPFIVDYVFVFHLKK
jgi:TonB family protein